MTRYRFVLVVGAVMMGLGVFIAVRPLLFPQVRITGSVALDVAFALFFLVRGYVNVRVATRALRANAPDTTP